MNAVYIKIFSLIIFLTLSLTACSKVGDLVSNTGDFVSKTGKIISGKNDKDKGEAPKIGEVKMPEIKMPEIPKVIKIKEEKAATAKVQVRATSKLAQSRISVTILQLKSGGKLSSSRLSELESDAESAIGSDFISKQSVSLKRGESKLVNFTIDPATKMIGVFASYKELNQTIWRSGVDLPKATNASYKIQINVNEKAVSVTK